jgi:hypothetical protein
MSNNGNQPPQSCYWFSETPEKMLDEKALFPAVLFLSMALILGSALTTIGILRR